MSGYVIFPYQIASTLYLSLSLLTVYLPQWSGLETEWLSGEKSKKKQNKETDTYKKS